MISCFVDIVATRRLLRADPPHPALSPSTVRRIHATLHKALADAVRWQLIPRNPAAFADPKTAQGRRSVALDRATVEALRGHRKHQLEQRLLVGADFRDHGLVFAHPDSEPLNLNLEYVSRRFQRLVRSAGFRP
jgi:hypothetical protein